MFTVGKNTQLLDNGKITAYIDTLKHEHSQRHEVTVDSIALELEEARTVAKENGQAGAMVSASMSKAKLYGLVKDKHEIKNAPEMPSEIVLVEMTVEELEREIKMRDLPLPYID